MPSYRSQSRSPAAGNTCLPATSTAFGSRTPTFQPPSFYAAAAGVSSQTSSRQRCKSNDEPQDRNSHGVPLSYPTQPGRDKTEGTASAGRTNGTSQTRSPSVSRPLGRSKSSREGAGKATQSERPDRARSSQFMDLPLLETHLLPSLRDTIDRMTHPPAPKNKASAEETSLSRPRQRDSPMIRPETSYISEPPSRSPIPTPSSAARLPYDDFTESTRFQVSQRVDVGPKTPKIPSSAHATPVPASSPNVATRSVLQTPRIRDGMTANAGSSRIVRYRSTNERDSEERGYQTNHSRSEWQSKKLEPSSGTRNTPQLGQNSHDSNVRAAPKLSKYAPKSPNPPSSSDTHTGRSTLRSGIPQPKYPATTATDSDLAQDYGRRLTSGRLVVTNGGVAPSSSDDENTDYDSAAVADEYLGSADRYGPSKQRSRLPYLQEARFPGRPPGAQVGLGLAMTPNGHVEGYFSSELSEDGRSTDGENGRYGWQEDIEHVMDAPRGIHEPSSERSQQEVALAGIVNGLNTQFGWYSTTNGKGRLSQGESGYNTSGMGLAIGDTRDIHGDSMRGPTGSTNDPRRGPYQNQRVAYQEPVKRDRREIEQQGRSSRSRDEPRRHRDDETHNISRRSGKSNRRSMSQPPAVAVGRSNTPQYALAGDTSRPESSRKTRQRAYTSAMGTHELHTEREVSDEREFRGSKRTTAKEGESHRTPRIAIHDAANREREGFGIPTSLSFRGSDGQRDTETSDPRHLRGTNPLPHVESDLSELGANGWEEQNGGQGELSHGAEALFRELSGKPEANEEGSRKHRRRGMTVGHPPTTSSGSTSRQPSELQMNRARHSRSLSMTSSVPSIYEEPTTSPQNDLPPDEPGYLEIEAWRSTMSEDAYRNLLAKYGSDEMRRQNAIFELFASEDTFSAQLRMILRQFIRPLRHKDSKHWIPGVPAPVARLFDWFNDIINLHLGMAIAMKAARRTWRDGGIITKLTDIFVGFTPRLEIYQPYLVKVRSVTAIISHCVSGGRNDFGEFIKIREQDPDCGGWTLAQLLYEPVKHLATYPESFLRILQVTPWTHPDHLPMLSLYYSSRMMMRIMDEVRKREEAYQSLKQILNEIEGLPPSVQLASRQRRVLWQGTLAVTRVVESVSIKNGPSSSGRGQSNKTEYGDRLTTPKIVIGYALDENNQQVGGRRTKQQRTESPERAIPVQVYILNDLMILATPTKKGRRRDGKPWRLWEEGGVSKLLGLMETSSNPDATDVMIDLLPIPFEELEYGENLNVTRLRVALFSDDRRGEVVDALQKCYGDTLRSLSFPSSSDQNLRLGLEDLEADTQQSVTAITSAGLPMPKSPSMQKHDLREGTAGDAVDQEREERGWWSLRFQQVLGEIRRQDPLTFSDLKAPLVR